MPGTPAQIVVAAYSARYTWTEADSLQTAMGRWRDSRSIRREERSDRIEEMHAYEQPQQKNLANNQAGIIEYIPTTEAAEHFDQPTK